MFIVFLSIFLFLKKQHRRLPEMESETSLVKQFKACHFHLDELFLLQEALLQAKLDNALIILKIFKTCHDLHMRFEDDKLIPKYASLPEQGKWDATLYQQEHQKVLELYKKIEQGLSWLVQQDLNLSQLRRNIIKLLDRQKSFKGLCEHHQEREESSLFVELDRQSDANWRVEIRTSFSEIWDRKIELEFDSIRSLS
jgi:hypothetical protein